MAYSGATGGMLTYNIINGNRIPTPLSGFTRFGGFGETVAGLGDVDSQGTAARQVHHRGVYLSRQAYLRLCSHTRRPMGISPVTGASGFLGSHIVDRLIARGETVRAFVRPTSATAYLKDRGAELAIGGLTDEPSLAAAFKGVDTVYHAAAIVTN